MDVFNDRRHRQSEELVFRAERLERSGHREDARGFYRQAAAPELELARSLSEPTLRSVFALSAVTCLLRGGEWRAATLHAYEFLGAPTALTDEAFAALEDLADEARRGEARSFLPDGVPLEIRLEGGLIRHGISPSRLVQERAEIVRALLVRLADFLSGAIFRRAGRSRAASAFTLYEEPARAASYGLRFVVSGVPQSPIPSVDVTPEELVNRFLGLAAAISAEGGEGMRGLVPDGPYANAFLRAFRDLAPDGTAVGAVSYRAPLSPLRAVSARFTPDHRQSLSRDLLRSRSSDAREIVGILKTVRLHRARGILVVDDDNGEHWLRLTDTGHDDTIGPKLNRRVKVFVSRHTRRDGRVHDRVEDVVLLEEPTPG
jgi:hypothetical protein